MIQIDNTDFLYKTLQKLGIDEKLIENEYLKYANQGIANLKDFNNNLQAQLGLDYLGDFDENCLEEVVDYYKDLKLNKNLAKSKVKAMLKEYQQSRDDNLKVDIINSQLQDVLLIACAYKLRHTELNLSDLVQICNLGLITAVDKYQSDTKLSFETYLNYWILDAINKEFTQGEKNG